jgi:hypothetical protein
MKNEIQQLRIQLNQANQFIQQQQRMIAGPSGNSWAKPPPTF